MVSLTIDGQRVSVPAGTTILEAAKSVGIDIPTFCYDKELILAASCRICVVEAEGFRNLPAACATPVSEGMVVHTESEKVIEATFPITECKLGRVSNEAVCAIVDWNEAMHYLDDSLGICAFVSSFRGQFGGGIPYHIHNLPRLIELVTGLEFDKEKLWKVEGLAG